MTDGSKQITENPTASEIPTTAGMTTKVVKGSMWTLAGQIAPLAVSLFTTPFTIRLLGAEGYGVLILIGLIPTYLGFADFGMSLASTKFGSEAYAENNPEKEARIIRTAALIALISSVPIAAGLMIFARQIIELFNVPPNLQPEAVTALRIAAVTFVINFLCGIFNTPQLARLRMDLNTFINAGTRILGLIATPIAIYLGFGIVGAVTVLLTASLLQLSGHLFVSRHLLPELIGFEIDKSILRPLTRFGGPLVLSSIAAIVLTNSEKGILSAKVSSAALAHYSVAFTLANMFSLAAASLTQSLFPAFAQLQGESNFQRLSELYSRGIRISLLLLLPTLAIAVFVAKPFLSFWAGNEFGEESVLPFWILLAGVSFNLLAIFPNVSLYAAGQTSLMAKIYWIELAFYLVIVWIFASNFGAKGAAAAWSLRVIADAVIQFMLVRRLSGPEIKIPGTGYFLAAFAMFALPMLFTAVLNMFFVGIIALIAALAAYLFVFLRRLLKYEEIQFINVRFGLIGRLLFG